MSIAEYSLNNPPPASPVTSTTLPTGISTINATLGCGSSGPISPDTGPLGSLHKSDSTTQAQFDKPSVVPRSFISPSPLSASSLVTASTTSANDDYSFNLSRALSSVDLNCNSSAMLSFIGKLAGSWLLLVLLLHPMYPRPTTNTVNTWSRLFYAKAVSL